MEPRVSAIETAAGAKFGTHWSVRVNYRLRTASFAILFAAVGVHFMDKHAPLGAWIALTLQFLIYPHVMYQRSKRAAHQARTERANMAVDIALMGGWTAALHFPLWI